MSGIWIPTVFYEIYNNFLIFFILLRLIDDVLKESITASGRKPVAEGKELNDRDILTANIQILLDWTIPDEYMTFFKAEKKTVEEILEELAA